MVRLRASWRHGLLLLPLLLLLAWVVARGAALREDHATVLAALRAAHGPQLPEADSAGATSRTTPERFDRETLYELINGAADAYLARGFESCITADYEFASSTGTTAELTAEIHRFEGARGAAEQLASEMPGAASPVVGLDQAFSDGTVLLAAWDRDFVKLVRLSADPAGAEALMQLARALRENS